MDYISAKDRKEAGIHYTPKILADFVAKQILKSWSCLSKSKKIRLIDPAVGDGQLLLSILTELSTKGYSNIEVAGFDTNSSAVEAATLHLEAIYPELSISLTCLDFLDFVATSYVHNGQYSLFTSTNSEPFDIVIANPPYVRTQVLGKAKAQSLARQFNLSGRVDLYHAFLAGIANALRPDGVVGIIVSNRFLTTKSGVSIRKSIIEKFNVVHIWDLGDTRLFEAAVLPAVLLLKRKNGNPKSIQPSFTSIYSTSDATPKYFTENVIAALDKEGVVRVENDNCFIVQQGKLDYENDPARVWKIATQTSEGWLVKVNANTFCTFGDIGKIRVGVKTTADKVFIRSDWQDMLKEETPELLRPLTTHHIAQRFRAAQVYPQKKILYPHQVVEGKRKAVNLEQYPQSAKYLYSYRSVLEKREYVQKAGRQWYEIWVPQNPEAWKNPKVVFRDITDKPTFWMDLSGSVVNGDCYWLTCNDPQQIDLLWLVLAVGNSSFIETFYDYKFNNKLYAGRRRFMTQYVEKFPLPDPKAKISAQIIQITKKIYDLMSLPTETDHLEIMLDQLVWKAFGLSVEKVMG